MQSSAAGAGGAKYSSVPADDSGSKEFSAAFYRTRLISFAAMVIACAVRLFARGLFFDVVPSSMTFAWMHSAMRQSYELMHEVSRGAVTATSAQAISGRTSDRLDELMRLPYAEHIQAAMCVRDLIHAPVWTNRMARRN